MRKWIAADTRPAWVQSRWRTGPDTGAQANLCEGLAHWERELGRRLVRPHQEGAKEGTRPDRLEDRLRGGPIAMRCVQESIRVQNSIRLKRAGLDEEREQRWRQLDHHLRHARVADDHKDDEQLARRASQVVQLSLDGVKGAQASSQPSRGAPGARYAYLPAAVQERASSGGDMTVSREFKAAEQHTAWEESGPGHGATLTIEKDSEAKRSKTRGARETGIANGDCDSSRPQLQLHRSGTFNDIVFEVGAGRGPIVRTGVSWG
eukprot:CAMPEP_0202075732 /NCGR_PEP_ID=MMETSP0964-20121228/4380_1 /ASSEMBLY_ACC=CAM_ASM_000500 /TAXON_ID=4773 /ORGANISM="Schizochytrium aggregatum, Strain ATCC28209" /LENGTH=262 /DNA_ID=CAMNT_0048642935 /DNA_START=52 /DNA_END=842 /DNA_ORIENTATION=+